MAGGNQNIGRHCKGYEAEAVMGEGTPRQNIIFGE